MNKFNALEREQMAKRFFMNEGMTQTELIEKQSEGSYCVIEFDDYGIEDKIGAFIIHLSNMGELDEVPPGLHKYLNFNKWYVDFVQDGGKVAKLRKNTYIISW